MEFDQKPALQPGTNKPYDEKTKKRGGVRYNRRGGKSAVVKGGGELISAKVVSIVHYEKGMEKRGGGEDHCELCCSNFILICTEFPSTVFCIALLCGLRLAKGDTTACNVGTVLGNELGGIH